MMNMVSKKVSANSSKVQASSLLRKGQQEKKTPTRSRRDSEIFPTIDDCYPDPRRNQRLKGHSYPIPYASD